MPPVEQCGATELQMVNKTGGHLLEITWNHYESLICKDSLIGIGIPLDATMQRCSMHGKLTSLHKTNAARETIEKAQREF